MTMRVWVYLVFALASSNAFSQAEPPTQLSLEEAVSFAMKNSPVLRASRAEIAAARAETGVAKSRAGVQLSANGFASGGNMPAILSSSMGVEPPAFVQAPDKGFQDINLALMLPLHTGGVISGLIAKALALEQAAIAEASGMRAEVALKVRESYIRALYAVELVSAYRSRVVAAEAMAANARTRFVAGSGIEATVRRAEAEVAEDQKELTMAENERQKMLLDLLAEMGASMEKPVVLGDTFRFAPSTLSLEESIRQADKSRGELISARMRVRAAMGQANSANGALRPQVYGFAMGEAFSPQDSMGKRSGYTFGISVSLPIFDGGMRRSEVAAARAMVERAKAEADRFKVQVEREVRQAWLDIETAAQNYLTATSALRGSQASYEVMAVRVESGKGILVEQLDALATLTRARANVAQALFEHHLAIAKLNRAIGIDETRKVQEAKA